MLTYNDEQMLEKDALAISVATCFYLKLYDKQLLFNDSVNVLTASYLMRILFPAILSVLFVGLMINYFVFNSISGKYNTNIQKLKKGEKLLKEVDLIQQQIQDKKTFIEDNKTNF